MAVLEFDREGVPLDKTALFKRMQCLDEDIVSEYLDGILEQIQSLLTWRDILSCVKSSDRCQRLIDGLEEEKLERLRQITTILGKKDLLKHIQTLLNESFCLDPPHCTSETAALFVETIGKIEPQRREEIALAYGSGAREMRNFSEIVLALNRGLLGEEFFIKLNETEMERLLVLANELTK